MQPNIDSSNLKGNKKLNLNYIFFELYTPQKTLKHFERQDKKIPVIQVSSYLGSIV